MLLLFYTLSSPPLHKHYDSQSSLIVSWQWMSTQKLALQITMNSSCYFIFNHSVCLCPNLYSINLHNSQTTCSILVLVLSTALHCTSLSYNMSLLYRLCTDHTKNTSHMIAIQRVHWRADCCLATSYNIHPLRHSFQCCALERVY
jgi:hypothetical protein